MRYQDFARKDLDGALTKWEEHLDRTGSKQGGSSWAACSVHHWDLLEAEGCVQILRSHNAFVRMLKS